MNGALDRAIGDLLSGEVSACCVQRGRVVPRPPQGRLLFPGSFHPLHQGHLGIAQAAASLLDRPVEMELSILNVDKPDLSAEEIQRRLVQFPPQHAVWVTRAATFESKAGLFPRATFIVGIDTLQRIAEPSYYGDDAGRMEQSFRAMAAGGARFLVFGRLLDGRFISLDQLSLPGVLRPLCEGVAESQFRCDVSSRELRRAPP